MHAGAGSLKSRPCILLPSAASFSFPSPFLLARPLLPARSRRVLPRVLCCSGKQPAVNTSASGRVAVLATAGTVAGAKLAALTAAHAAGAAVWALPMPGLAALVESGEVRE